MVGPTDRAGSRIRTFSGGRRRRPDVTLGVVGRPEVRFLDEPTTGFDPAVRCQLWELIRRESREGTTILLTTHYLDADEYAHPGLSATTVFSAQEAPADVRRHADVRRRHGAPAGARRRARLRPGGGRVRAGRPCAAALPGPGWWC